MLKFELILERQIKICRFFANRQWVWYEDMTQIVLYTLHRMLVVWESRQLP